MKIKVSRKLHRKMKVEPEIKLKIKKKRMKIMNRLNRTSTRGMLATYMLTSYQVAAT